mgnify:CR=1 FL=1
MHAPVLLDEAIAALDLHEGDFAIDGTLGGGGHAKAMLAQIGRSGRLLGVDCDDAALARACTALGDPRNVLFVHGSYAELPDILAREKLPKANALLLDLGLSSDQLSALLSVSGWRTSRGRDICPACAPSFVPQERKS